MPHDAKLGGAPAVPLVMAGTMPSIGFAEGQPAPRISLALQLEPERLEHARRIAKGPAGWLSPTLRRLRRVRLQTISGDEALGRLPPSSRIFPDWPMLERLRDEGRSAADDFLARCPRP